MRRLFIGFSLLAIIGLLLVGIIAITQQPAPVQMVHIEPVARLGRGWVTALAWSPEGETVAVASAVGIWLYEAADLHAEPRLLEGHSEPVSSLAFSPDGRWLASGSWDKSIRLWDMRTGEVYSVFSGHNGAVESLAFSPDSTVLLSGGVDSTVRVWDLATGEERASLKEHDNTVSALAFSPDGRFFASGSRYNQQLILLWDAQTHETLQTFQGISGVEVDRLAFSADSGQLFGLTQDGKLRIWDTESYALLSEQAAGLNLALHPASGQIATATDAETVTLFTDVSTPESTPLTLTTGRLRDLAFHPDGTQLISVNVDNVIQLWDLNTGQALQTLAEIHTGGVTAVAFQDDSNVVAGTGTEITGPSSVHIWDLATEAQTAILPGENGFVQSLDVSPNGQSLVIGTQRGVLEFRDAEGDLLEAVQAHQGRILSVTFSGDSGTVASGGEDASARLWEPSGQLREALTDLGGPIRHINLLDGGSIMPSAGLQDVMQLAGMGEFNLGCSAGDGVTSMLFSPDRKFVASAYWNSTISISLLDTGALHATLEGHFGNIWSVVFSPDSRLLASAGMDRIIRIWDVSTGREIAQIPGHHWEINSLAFSPDGTLLASGSGDGTVRLWRIAPGPKASPV